MAEIKASIGFPRTTWNGYELGTSYPSFKDLLKISEFFDISIDKLIKTDLSNTHLTENENSRKNQAKTHLKTHPNTHLNDKYSIDTAAILGHKTVIKEDSTAYKKQDQPAVITLLPSGSENIIYVPVKAQAGYLLGHGDQSYIEKLPAFSMPGLHNGTFRMFEVEGLSMSPTLSNKDRVIAQWVPSISEIRENRVHVLVLKDGIVIKRVLNRVNERGLLYLKSDTLTHRQDHPIIDITPDQILEIWYVRMKVSGDLSEPSELYNRMSELEINMHEIMKKLGLPKP